MALFSQIKFHLARVMKHCVYSRVTNYGSSIKHNCTRSEFSETHLDVGGESRQNIK